MAADALFHFNACIRRVSASAKRPMCTPSISRWLTSTEIPRYTRSFSKVYFPQQILGKIVYRRKILYYVFKLLVNELIKGIFLDFN